MSNKKAVVEVIKALLKEEPNKMGRWKSAIGELLDEGFGNETVDEMDTAFFIAERPERTPEEKAERQRFMDEAAGIQVFLVFVAKQQE